jgi:hypothetical protein
MKTVTVELSFREITLLRCGLLRRMYDLKRLDRLKNSLEDSKTLLQKLWDVRKPLESDDANEYSCDLELRARNDQVGGMKFRG